jgi:hypothetical protein
MKTVTFLLLLTVVSIKVDSQNEEFLYTNAELGFEVKFPCKPVESEMDLGIIKVATVTTTPEFSFSTGLSYILTISYSTLKSDGAKSLSYLGTIVNKSEYKVGRTKATELELSYQGTCNRFKVIDFKDASIKLQVMGESLPKDKDVYPFFNSLKIKGVLIQNPIADNSRFKEYALDYLSKTKTDTIKQFVYVSSDSKISYQYEKLSDVDRNIPQNAESSPNRFALIIGNEDYSSQQTDLKSESNVDFARNDASAFKEYCISTLGIPAKNITFLLDATKGQISQGINLLKLLSKASNGKAQLIVFYAGHGLPDETTKEPYLIPVDVSGASITSGIKLQDLYSNLTEFPSERITVYLDACFTGGGRNAGLIASRGVKVKPKEGVLKGNIVVYSSSSGDQSSLPYADQKHGMFTYYLLKKLQETKGDVTYSDLSTFLQEKISIESLLVNSKEQNPVVNASQDVAGRWESWRLK